AVAINESGHSENLACGILVTTVVVADKSLMFVQLRQSVCAHGRIKQSTRLTAYSAGTESLDVHERNRKLRLLTASIGAQDQRRIAAGAVAQFCGKPIENLAQLVIRFLPTAQFPEHFCQADDEQPSLARGQMQIETDIHHFQAKLKIFVE